MKIECLVIEYIQISGSVFSCNTLSGVIVIVVESGFGYPSSNPERACL